MSIARIVLPLIATASLTACAGPPTTASSSPPALVDFTQAIPATALSFEMVAVCDADPFYIARTETTWNLYDVFVFTLDESETTGVDAISRPSKPYIAMDRNFGHAGYPAISVNAKGAESFCRWLSAKTGRTYRLPTEDEWQRACDRSGISVENAAEHAWYVDNANYKTHPVATRSADAQGIHDLWGNASEWCVASDGTPITLGGTYRDDVDAIGCAYRKPYSDAWNASDPQFPKSEWWLADAGFVGFRVVCEPETP